MLSGLVLAGGPVAMGQRRECRCRRGHKCVSLMPLTDRSSAPRAGPRSCCDAGHRLAGRAGASRSWRRPPISRGRERQERPCHPRRPQQVGERRRRSPAAPVGDRRGLRPASSAARRAAHLVLRGPPSEPARGPLAGGAPGRPEPGCDRRRARPLDLRRGPGRAGHGSRRGSAPVDQPDRPRWSTARGHRRSPVPFGELRSPVEAGARSAVNVGRRLDAADATPAARRSAAEPGHGRRRHPATCSSVARRSEPATAAERQLLGHQGRT